MDIQIICRSRKIGFWRFPSKLYYPLLAGVRQFSKLGVKIRYQFHLGLSKSTDIAIVDGKLFYRKSTADCLAFLKHLQKYSRKIIWYDNRDSAGDTRFEVLPFVDAYYKNQLYIDLDDYKKVYICNRKHTDFFSKQFELKLEAGQCKSLELFANHVHKLQAGWNLGCGNFVHTRGLAEIFFLHILKRARFPKFAEPSSCRKIDIHTRFRVGSDPTYAMHRALALELVKSLNCVTPTNGRVSKAEFASELRNTKIVVSPFGWGEVCYRDFEAILNGACLVKPDMGHLVTWPNIYLPNESYISVKWDLSDLPDVLAKLLADDGKRINIAERGQAILRKVHSQEGILAFCQRYKDTWAKLIAE